MDRPALRRSGASFSSIGSPSTFQSRPSVASPTGTEIGAARVDDVHAAREPVGRVHGHGAHAVVAEMLLHLRDQVAAPPPCPGNGDLQRVVDLGQRSGKTASMTTPLISMILPTFALRLTVCCA